MRPLTNKRRAPGEKTARIKRLRKDALLTRSQVEAIHHLHIAGGLSVREICRRGWQQWGYASEKSAVNSVLDLMRSFNLQPRDRVEATVRASTTHGRGARKDKPAYKRWHRKTFGPWPSDLHRSPALPSRSAEESSPTRRLTPASPTSPSSAPGADPAARSERREPARLETEGPGDCHD